MPQKYFGRIVLILGILLVSVLAIFPPGSLFDASVPWSKKLNLKPGIDMAGGTKLVYEIKAPDDEFVSGDLATEVMNALKRRVDPDGVRNLVWRPQGGRRLEIQMPLGMQSEEAKGARDRFSNAQKALDETNVRRSEVIRAVERLSGDARRDRLNELAMGSTQRETLFGGLIAAYDQVKAAEAAKDEAKQAEAEILYDNLKEQIDDTNVTSGDLQVILDARPEVRERRLADLRARNEGFDTRLNAITTYITAWEQYAGVRGELDDAGELKRLLRGSGVLQFHILVDGTDLASAEAREMIERLESDGKGVAPQANDRMRWFEVEKPDELSPSLVHAYNDRYYALAWITPDRSMVKRPGQLQWALKRAYPAQDQMGMRAVGFEFDANGAVLFGELTGNNLQKLLSVMLDGKIISAATIQSAIGSSGIITRGSGYATAEFDYLIRTLNAGSLPAQLAEDPISEQTVGPQLGADNLRMGLYTCMFGLVVVAVFLISYYYLSGVVAMIAIVMNVIVILGAMAAFDATFTLPGVAGIILAIGCSVDANVLIFERIREEQKRGMGLRMAVRNGYDRAFSAIFDSNVTTAITAAILYWAGSEEVKGFGLTLMLGMAISMFTALFVTRTIFGLLIDKVGITGLSSLPLTFPKWDKLLRPSIDWMSKARYAYIFSLLFIVVGLSLFIAKWNQNEILDIEFASGTSVQVELREPMRIEEVRSRVEEIARQRPQELPVPAVVSVGTGGKTYEIVTPNPIGRDVREAVVAALGDQMIIQIGSQFDMVGTDYDSAQRSGVIVPVTRDELELPERTIEDASAHASGVAIVLRNLNPMLTAEEIEQRIEHQRLQPLPGGGMLPYRDMDVVALEEGENGLLKSAAVLVSDSKFPFDRDPVAWQSELAVPMWQLVNDAVNNPEQLQKVTNFDPQVATATQLRALVALTLSTIVIMLYIWFRFGDLTFGGAATIATLHDVFFVIAAIGFAHYVANTALGEFLMIEAFRMNLTLVAAVLTVMGYSLNDTVVVFDRIRENRGKYGSLNPGVINDSINQTLSRTLLTGSTTIVTIGMMYLFGGSTIHGFTFALLVGIIVGTYSSVAVAAPLLLFRSGRQGQARSKRVTPVAQPST